MKINRLYVLLLPFFTVSVTVCHHLHITPSYTMSNAETFNALNQKTAACKKLIDDMVHGQSPLNEFLSNLKDIGVSLQEAQDYVQHLEQRIHQQGEHSHHGSEQ